MVESLNQALFHIMEKDSSVVVLGEDVGIDGGVFRVTQGLIDKFGDRVIDTPIAEAGIIGASLGMAINKLKPVAEIQFSGFIYPGFQQIISHVSRMRNRSRSVFDCNMVIRTNYGGGVNAMEHHSESYEAGYSHIPGLVVVIPSTPYDAKGLLLSAINYPDPVLFLEPKKLYRAFREEVPDEHYEVPIGQAEIKKEGNEITIISWGAMMPVALDVAANSNYSCEVIDLKTISPWDKETVIKSVNKTGRCIVLHEAVKSGGWGGEICASISEECFLHLKAPVGRVTGPDTIVPLLKSEHYFRPNAEMLEQKINKIMEY